MERWIFFGLKLFFGKMEILSQQEWLKKVNTSIFFVKGGTWLMKVLGENHLKSEGPLGDDEIARLEMDSGYDEKTFAGAIYNRIVGAKPIDMLPSEFFGWTDSELVRRSDIIIVPLLSADSSHRRTSVAASLMYYELILQQLTPSIRKLQGTGTDTGYLYVSDSDVFLFDSKTAPIVTGGSRQSYHAPMSDAPFQFEELFKTLQIPLRPGAYYQWRGWIYPGADVVKVDPSESRRVDGDFGFASPHQLRFPNTPESDYFGKQSAEDDYEVPVNHPIRKLTSWEDVYDAMAHICTLDLTNQNHYHSLDQLLEHILNSNNWGIVVVGFGLGNVNNPVKLAAVEAVKRGKLVVGVSGCLVSHTNTTYDSVSLIGANQTLLANSEAKIIDGGVLSKTLARAILIRSLLENHTQSQCQALVDAYIQSRFPKR